MKEKMNDDLEKELLQALQDDAEAEYQALGEGRAPDADGFVQRMQEMLDEYEMLRRQKQREKKMRQWGMAMAAIGLATGLCLLAIHSVKKHVCKQAA